MPNKYELTKPVSLGLTECSNPEFSLPFPAAAWGIGVGRRSEEAACKVLDQFLSFLNCLVVKQNPAGGDLVTPSKPGMVTHASHYSTREAKTGGSKFGASLDYMTLLHKPIY